MAFQTIISKTPLDAPGRTTSASIAVPSREQRRGTLRVSPSTVWGPALGGRIEMILEVSTNAGATWQRYASLISQAGAIGTRGGVTVRPRARFAIPEGRTFEVRVHLDVDQRTLIDVELGED